MLRSDRWLGAAAADAIAVVVFAVAGRSAHSDSAQAGTVATIAAPFLIGLLAGWLADPHARRHPLALRTGVVVWLATVVIGLVLRRTLWDRGTAASFVVVTAVVLGALMVGWRAMWVGARRRRGLQSASPPSQAGR